MNSNLSQRYIERTLRPVARIALALAIMSVVPLHGAASQELSVGASITNVRHDFIGGDMIGAAATLAFPSTNEAWTWRFGFETASRTRHRVGQACIALFLPPTCPVEPIRDRADVRTLMLGVGRRILHRSHVELRVTGDAGVALLRDVQRGTTTNKSVRTSGTQFGGEVGAEAAYTPSARWPVALRVRTALGGFAEPKPEVVDGYTPLASGMSLVRTTLGVTIRLPHGK